MRQIIHSNAANEYVVSNHPSSSDWNCRLGC